jgi:GNAT superfamily N-acetyltransferase
MAGIMRKTRSRSRPTRNPALVLSFRELTTSEEDRGILRRFYEETYRPAFPQPDEQEAVERLEGYLAFKARGGYGPNNYHILVALHRDRPVAGVIMDYLAEANAGIVEFIVTTPGWRRYRLGSRMLRWAERAAAADARRSLGRGLDLMLAELEDPFKFADDHAHPDPFDRLGIWDGWGFRKLDFPYVQPALSRAQRPVTHLLLAAKPINPALREHVPSRVVERAVHEYIRWAMMPLRPARSPEYKRMRRYLARRRAVPLLSLRAYLGRAPGRDLHVHEITGARDADLGRVARLYTDTFPAGATSLRSDAFAASLSRSRRDGRYAYHLWALRSTPAGGVGGMASFFTLPGAGFGGYVAFGPPLRGTGRFGALVARIEEQMVRDGRGATGWYVECDPGGPQGRILQELGFHEVAITYRQPTLPGGEPHATAGAPVLRLLYKEFGRVYEAPQLSQRALLSALRWIYRAVYGIERPGRSPLFAHARAQVARMPGGLVAWR